MNKLPKILLVAVLTVVGFFAADAAMAGAQNDSEDDISSETDQAGASNSGDAVGGQVVGVVSAGDASVDSTNRSEDVDIETGDAGGFNGVEQIVGQTIADSDGENESEAEISSEVAQDASASTGDGVGGAVIGVVTSAGGSADVVAANTSEDADIETGDAFVENEVLAGIGQGNFGDAPENDSEDDISAEVGQTAAAASGDGVGGQVLGIVSAGDASVDATNESTDVDVETGDAFVENFVEHDVGQEIDTGDADNFSDGEISSEIAQDASANSGDAVAGQVAGVVTSAGGSADLVLANTSEDVDGETGDSDFFNETVEFVGQFADS
jgi:hypothetical protein